MAETAVVLEQNGANPVLQILNLLHPYFRAHQERAFLRSTVERWFVQAGARVERSQMVNLVSAFLPSALARLMKSIEPVVEKIPLIRDISCGQYSLTATRLARPDSDQI